MNLGNTIKNLRQKQGIKQNALAKSCNISQTYLSQIENNVKEPNISVLKNIANKIGVPLPIIFFLSMEVQDIKPEKREAYKHLAPSINSMLADFFPKTLPHEKWLLILQNI